MFIQSIPICPAGVRFLFWFHSLAPVTILFHPILSSYASCFASSNCSPLFLSIFPIAPFHASLGLPLLLLGIILVIQIALTCLDGFILHMCPNRSNCFSLQLFPYFFILILPSLISSLTLLRFFISAAGCTSC